MEAYFDARGMTHVARHAGSSRERLYKALGTERINDFETLRCVKLQCKRQSSSMRVPFSVG